MNRYLFLHRIRGPVMILIFGVTALLNQWGILSYGESWPLYLIALGVLQLAERAAWSQAQAGGPYPGTYTPGAYPGQPGGWTGVTPPPPPSSGLTVTPPDRPRGFGPEDEERK
jgi:hypothetical protein